MSLAVVVVVVRGVASQTRTPINASTSRPMRPAIFMRRLLVVGFVWLSRNSVPLSMMLLHSSGRCPVWIVLRGAPYKRRSSEQRSISCRHGQQQPTFRLSTQHT
jgi:hypothetical protein